MTSAESEMSAVKEVVPLITSVVKLSNLMYASIFSAISEGQP